MYADYRAAVLKGSEQAKALALRLVTMGSPAPLEMAYMKSGAGVPGQIVFFEHGKDKPSQCESTGEILRTDVPYENYFSWVAQRATRLPIL